MVFKFLISSLLVASSLPAEGEDGWFSVPKTPKVEAQAEEDDPSIWVIFTKNLGTENLFVRFPEAPTYRYTEAGDLEITARKEGEIFQVLVRSSSAEASPVQELHYEMEGKWVHEHLIRTAHHLFHLKSTSLTPSAEIHRDFFSSFFIERIG